MVKIAQQTTLFSEDGVKIQLSFRQFSDFGWCSHVLFNNRMFTLLILHSNINSVYVVEIQTELIEVSDAIHTSLCCSYYVILRLPGARY